MINEKLEKLNQEIAKGEARLRRAQHEEKNTGTPGEAAYPEGTDAPALYQKELCWKVSF